MLLTRGAERESRLIGGRTRTDNGDFCQTKIQDLGVAVLGHEDVGRLDIAMNDPLGMGRIQSVGDPNGDVQQRLHLHGSFVNQML